jgi:hypothetical protein
VRESLPVKVVNYLRISISKSRIFAVGMWPSNAAVPRQAGPEIWPGLSAVSVTASLISSHLMDRLVRVVGYLGSVGRSRVVAVVTLLALVTNRLF